MLNKWPMISLQKSLLHDSLLLPMKGKEISPSCIYFLLKFGLALRAAKAI